MYIPLYDDDETMFTQDQVNTFNKKERLRAEAAEKTSEEQSDIIKQLQNGNDEERAAISLRLQELEDQNMSASEKSAKEISKLTKKLEDTTADLTGQVGEWQGRFSQEKVTNAILAATASGSETEACNPTHFINLLGAQAKLSEDHVPVIENFTHTDPEDQKQTITETVSVAEAIKHMYSMPEHANLFKSKVVAGQGNTGGDTKSDPIEPAKMTQEQYYKWHDANVKGGRTFKRG